MSVIIYKNGEKGKLERLYALLPLCAILLAITALIGGYKLYTLVHNRQPVSIEYTTMPSVTPFLEKSSTSTEAISASRVSGAFVAARGGKSYYKPSCAGAQRIAEKNKIWFDTKAEAEKFGYKPAKNCK